MALGATLPLTIEDAPILTVDASAEIHGHRASEGRRRQRNRKSHVHERRGWPRVVVTLVVLHDLVDDRQRQPTAATIRTATTGRTGSCSFTHARSATSFADSGSPNSSA